MDPTLAASKADLIQIVIVILIVGVGGFVNWVKSLAEARKRALDQAQRSGGAPQPAPAAPTMAMSLPEEGRRPLAAPAMTSPPVVVEQMKQELARRRRRAAPEPVAPRVELVAAPAETWTALEPASDAPDAAAAPASSPVRREILPREVAARLTEAQRFVVAAEIFGPRRGGGRTGRLARR